MSLAIKKILNASVSDLLLATKNIFTQRFRFCQWGPKIFNASVSALFLATKGIQRNGFGFVFGDQRYSAPVANKDIQCTGFGFAFGDQKYSAQRFRFFQWQPKIFNAPASALLLATKDFCLASGIQKILNALVSALLLATKNMQLCLWQPTIFSAVGDQGYSMHRFWLCFWRPKIFSAGFGYVFDGEDIQRRWPPRIFNAPVWALLLVTQDIPKDIQCTGSGFAFGEQIPSAAEAHGWAWRNSGCLGLRLRRHMGGRGEIPVAALLRMARSSWLWPIATAVVGGKKPAAGGPGKHMGGRGEIRTSQKQPDPAQSQPEPTRSKPEPARANQKQPAPTKTSQP